MHNYTLAGMLLTIYHQRLLTLWLRWLMLENKEVHASSSTLIGKCHWTTILSPYGHALTVSFVAPRNLRRYLWPRPLPLGFLFPIIHPLLIRIQPLRRLHLLPFILQTWQKSSLEVILVLMKKMRWLIRRELLIPHLQYVPFDSQLCLSYKLSFYRVLSRLSKMMIS